MEELEKLLKYIGFIGNEYNDKFHYRYYSIRKYTNVYSDNYNYIFDDKFNIIINTYDEDHLINKLKELFKKEIRKNKYDKLFSK